MKRLAFSLLAMMMVFSVPGCQKKADDKADSAKVDGDKVKLVFTSWRTEDIERMNRINAEFTKKYPNIEIDFQPIKDTEYDAQLKASLSAGVGADIIFLRSYDSGYQAYKTGALENLNTVLPELKNFPAAAVKAWASPDGVSYGIPSVGVVHGVYYRKSVFKKYNLEVPETWDEFMKVCDVLLENNETVFAQGTKDDWTLYEVMYSGLGANFYGGEEARQQLMAGDAEITDENFLKAFRAMKQLQKYFPRGYQGIDYATMQIMFGTGQAAMFMGGSWEIGIIEDNAGGLEDIGYFAPPVVNAGDKLQYCFHVDAGIGMNKNTKYPEETKTYMKWLASSEYAQLVMNELPGFFSYTPGNYELKNSLAKQMQSYVADSVPTVRTVWEKLSAQSPSGNQLMGQALQKMYAAEGNSPEDAADFVANGLSWYTP